MKGKENGAAAAGDVPTAVSSLPSESAGSVRKGARVTVADVAVLAQVSPGTASRILRGDATLSAQSTTRERVMQVAESLGYYRHGLAAADDEQPLRAEEVDRDDLGWIAPEALSDQAYRLLKAQLVDMRISPGSKLSPEQLATRFGISATPIREALNRLAVEKFVVASPHKGFKASPLLSLEEIVDLLKVRIVLEQAAGLVLVGKGGGSGRLRTLAQQMKFATKGEVPKVGEFNELDREFHFTLVAAADNKYLTAAWLGLHAHDQIARHYHSATSRDLSPANREHEEICSAVERSDGDKLTALVSTHILGAFDRLRRRITIVGSHPEEGDG